MIGAHELRPRDGPPRASGRRRQPAARGGTARRGHRARSAVRARVGPARRHLLGNVHRQGDSKWAAEAVNATNRALTLDQQQPEVWISLAQINEGTGRREAALSALNKALELQPTSDAAHQLMGQVLQAMGRRKEARTTTARPSRSGRTTGATTACSAGSITPSAATPMRSPPLREVTELAPDNARGFHNLGAVYYRIGDNRNALANYEKALAINPMAGDAVGDRQHPLRRRALRRGPRGVSQGGERPRRTTEHCAGTSATPTRGSAATRRLGRRGARPSGSISRPGGQSERCQHPGTDRPAGSEAWRAGGGRRATSPGAGADRRRRGSALSFRGRARARRRHRACAGVPRTGVEERL